MPLPWRVSMSPSSASSWSACRSVMMLTLNSPASSRWEGRGLPPAHRPLVIRSRRALWIRRYLGCRSSAARLAVLTCAGISTDSGIPDFRSPGGVWSRMSPIYFQDFVRSEEKRREAWERTFSGRAGWVGRKPNAGHFAVARLIASGKAQAVITHSVELRA